MRSLLIIAIALFICCNATTAPTLPERFDATGQDPETKNRIRCDYTIGRCRIDLGFERRFDLTIWYGKLGEYAETWTYMRTFFPRIKQCSFYEAPFELTNEALAKAKYIGQHMKHGYLTDVYQLHTSDKALVFFRASDKEFCGLGIYHYDEPHMQWHFQKFKVVENFDSEIFYKPKDLDCEEI
ncbi:hypothetical protein RCL1_001707 [Eukaryota sp. TZLM3-RCL]